MESSSVQNGKNSSPTPPENPEAGNKITQKFNDFLETLGDTLMDFTALEVNTMIVSNITGAKFNAMEAYHVIYERSQQAESFPKPQQLSMKSFPKTCVLAIGNYTINFWQPINFVLGKRALSISLILMILRAFESWQSS